MRNEIISGSLLALTVVAVSVYMASAWGPDAGFVLAVCGAGLFAGSAFWELVRHSRGMAPLLLAFLGLGCVIAGFGILLWM